MMNETSIPLSSPGLLSSVAQLPTTILVASSIPLFFFILSFLISPKIDPAEPPAVWPLIPMVGHIIGMFRGGFKYYARPCKQSGDAPIITMPLLNGRMYLATGKDVISQIARNSRTLSFDPFVAPMAAKVCGADNHMVGVVVKNLDRSEGDDGYYININRRMKHLLAPGENLIRMEKSIFVLMSKLLQEANKTSDGKPTSFFRLMQDFLNKGTLMTLYGPKYPYFTVDTYPDDVYSFETGVDGLILGLWPSLTASKAFHARERMVAHLTWFLKDGMPPEANPLVHARFDEGVKAGLSIAEIARFEIAIIFAAIENSAPGAFWTLLRIWSCPGLVEELRPELLRVLDTFDPGHKPSDPLPFAFLESLPKTMPLMKSAFDEMLRLHSYGAQARYVLADTVLEGRDRDYLLKKDNVVMIPNVVLHHNEKVFPDAETFDPRRFLSEGAKPAEHRPWGGGGTICPGRHFATAETLALAAMFILGFDMKCVDSSGKQRDWWLPRDYQQSYAAGIFPPNPKDDILVSLQPRKGWNVAVAEE